MTTKFKSQNGLPKKQVNKIKYETEKDYRNIITQTTQQHIPENYNLYVDHCKDLKSKKCCDYLNTGMNNSNETH